MKPVCLLVALVCLAAPAAFAEEALTPVSKDALHFRLEVGVEAGHIVSGWLDARGEGATGFDSAVLDLDGDGAADTVQTFPMTTNYQTKAEVPHVKIVVPHDGAEWMVDLRYASFRKKDDASETYIRWTVTKGGFYAWFINGRVLFHPTAEAAAQAKAIRLGPPFSFDTGSNTRGRESLVRVGLKDVNGCTMRLARMDGKERKIRVELIEEDESRYETWASYG